MLYFVGNARVAEPFKARTHESLHFGAFKAQKTRVGMQTKVKDLLMAKTRALKFICYKDAHYTAAEQMFQLNVHSLNQLQVFSWEILCTETRGNNRRKFIAQLRLYPSPCVANITQCTWVRTKTF